MAAPVIGEYGKVIVITEALTYLAAAERLDNVLLGGPLWVDHIRWYDPAGAAADTVVITDKNDAPITTIVAGSITHDHTINMSQGERHWRGGFKVPTIAAGSTLEIHLA